MISNIKIYEKIFSDSKKPELFRGTKIFGIPFLSNLQEIEKT